MKRRIRDLLTIPKVSSYLGSLSYTFLHGLDYLFGMAKPVAGRWRLRMPEATFLIRIPARNHNPKLFFPLASENGVHRQVDIVIVKPFGLAQDTFFLKP
jgi:hypothetical protein